MPGDDATSGEMTAEAARARLNELILGYQASQAIHVAGALGLADLLADGVKTSAEIAAETCTHAGSLYRVLRSLASIGVLHEDDGHAFSLTAVGAQLRSDAAGSLAPTAALMTGPSVWQAWSALIHSVRTGEIAFDHVHGTGIWQHRAAHREEGAAFDRAMSARTEQIADATLKAVDLGQFGHIVDVGGGNGAFLARILAAHPHIRGTVFDQPQTAARAKVELSSLGLSDRCEAVGGSFFDAVPEGGDAYLLKYILHDWDDAASLAILRTCRRAMRPEARPGARLVVIDHVIEPPNRGARGKLMDLHMMAVTGGRERTAEEFAALLGEAGFALASVTPTASLLSVIVGVPA